MESEIVNGTWKGHLGRGLAPRELQFLLWVALGFTAKEIAREAGISPATVAKRLTSAMYKLGVTRRAALVAEAMRRQIISPMCFVLAALMAMSAVVNVQSVEPARRDRRPPSVRIAQVRITRRAETLEAA
ncbi:helix-turn-helix transcriptional regulator [Pseudomonas sp. FH1]|uniref:response regulator transcription factor n=1 Tax=Pseudomonas sp. FH1 TaxID=1284392 RepID=UPI0003DBD57D|nr:helix-turn-helix transcriptional regulator [Pseudomonas sp. FH1]ETK18127.1 LuxR family transcriptional regulator [Pseudomonas sp. FH1]